MKARLAVYSDLHLEFEKHYSPLRLADDADIRILAGDIGTQGDWIQWLLDQGDTPVVLVLGNHEYYHQAYPEHLQQLQSRLAGTHVHLLENDCVDLQGIRFLGATLWTDFELYGERHRDTAMNEAQQRLTDYRAISWSETHRTFTPSDSANLHKTSVAWLEAQLATADPKTTVVVTHHAPSPGSIEPQYRGSLTNGAFASDLEPLIERYQPRLWVHGHVHHSLDYPIGQTRVVCNPRGYIGVEPNEAFQNPFVVELD